MRNCQTDAKKRVKNISTLIEKIMAVTLLTIFYLATRNISESASKNLEQGKTKTIVIDPGHGGIDGGKQAGDGTLEKDINLSISLKLKEKLEKKGIHVVMTREKDCGLYAETDRNKKVADLQQRCKIMNDSHADYAVSIHQNSYSTAGVKGAQVFYYAKSEDAKNLAETLQEELADRLDKNNKRKAKENKSYYILLHTDCPSVIVECGFLSNPEEAELLKSDRYQEEIAEAVCKGIISKVLTTQ